MKQLILDTVSDMASNFLYYDRKEDPELTVGAIEKAVADGAITVDEIVDCFREAVESSCQSEKS